MGHNSPVADREIQILLVYWFSGIGIGKLRHHEPIAEKAIVRVVTALVQLTNYKHISHIKPFMGLITKEFTDTHCLTFKSEWSLLSDHSSFAWQLPKSDTHTCPCIVTLILPTGEDTLSCDALISHVMHTFIKNPIKCKYNG